ncbi:MAG: DNA gyrase inhibitor YacG [Pyrinomonadaceae bacterium]
MIVKCPTCSKRNEYEGNEFRPFCSNRCKLLDFGEWEEGTYSLPVQSISLSEEDLNQLETIYKKGTN